MAFDEHGVVLDVAIPEAAGPATFLVSPVTDAAKRVEGDRVVESIDREEIWWVEAFVLDRQVLDRLGDGSMSAMELLKAVRAAGYEWGVSSTSGP